MTTSNWKAYKLQVEEYFAAAMGTLGILLAVRLMEDRED